MDPRKKKVLSVLIIGSFILIWRVYAIVSDGLPDQTQARVVDLPEPEPEFPITQEVTDEDMKALWTLQEKLTARQWTDHDPFEGLKIKTPEGTYVNPEQAEPDDAPEPPKLVFNGVSNARGTRRALVNGRILKEGESFDAGIVVREITRNTLTLAHGPWRYTYRLGFEDVTVQASEEP